MSLFANEERRATVAGAVVLVILLGAVVFAVFLSGRIAWGKNVRARVDFEQVAGLQEGAPVMVAGRQVGTVESIGLLPGASLPAGSPLAATGGVVARIRIRAGRRDMVPVNGDFFISSRGILGERYLEVGPPKDGAAPGRPIADDDEVTGSSPPSIDRALQRTFDNLEVARRFGEDVGPQAHALGRALGELSATMAELDPGDGGWGGLSARFDAAIAEARTAWASLREAGADPAHAMALADSIARTTASARTALALLRARAQLLGGELDRALAQVEGGQGKLDRLRDALGKLDAISARLDDAMAKVQAITEALARGEGTLGKLANDPEFPEDAKELGKILKRQPWRVIGHP